MKLRSFIISVCITSTVLILGYFWLQHYRLSIVRYFDMDEFMYPHWAHNIFIGSLPYRDFFVIVPPVYLLFLVPTFWFFHGSQALVADRILSYGVAVGMGLSLGALFYQLRRSWIAVAAPLVLALLPLPQDKFMEIRPDNLAIVFVISGFAVLIAGLRTKKKLYSFLSGLLLGLSCLTLQKMFPMAGIAIIIVFIDAFSKRILVFIRSVLPFFVGFGFPFLIFFTWALSTGSWTNAWYDIINAPFEIIKLNPYIGAQPDFYFHPNSLYYGLGGITAGYVANLALWSIAICMAVLRLIILPWSGNKKNMIPELLINISFLSGVLLFIYKVPFRYSQYLIPSGVFVAFYVTDVLYFLWQKLNWQTGGVLLFGFLYVLGLLFSWKLFDIYTMPKFAWDNRNALKKIDYLVQIIPKEAYVMDLEGRSTYFKDPHYACCLPYGQFASVISRPFPSVASALQRTKTRYIYQAENNRINFQLPSDQEFIKSNYTPTLDNELWVAKYW